jgi:hypothetical protein
MYWVQARNVREFALRNPLVAAFLISLVIHTGLYGTWRLGKHLGWWDHQATWLLNLTKKRIKLSAREMAQLAQQQQQKRQQEVPLTFVEVDPSVATPESPKDAKFYGAQNSKATNPDMTVEAAQPKVDGRQEHVTKAEDTPRTKAQPLQPSLPPAEPSEEAKPKAEPIGDLAKAKPQTDPGDAVAVEQERPRTLAAARERKNIAGEKVKQEGGSKRRGRVSFDVTATRFGPYDAMLVAAVQERWYQLLDTHNFVQRSGKVVIEFQLHYDGSIRGVRMTGNEVGDMLGLLCQKAIQDPAPFAAWPADMRRQIGGNDREVSFTFYYN